MDRRIFYRGILNRFGAQNEEKKSSNEGKTLSERIEEAPLTFFGESIPHEAEILDQLRNDPSNGDLLYNLGMIYANRDDFPRAAEYLSRALGLRRKEVDDYDALMGLGVVLQHSEKERERDRAVDLMRRAVEVGIRKRVYQSKDDEMYDHEGVALAMLQLKRPTDAELYLKFYGVPTRIVDEWKKTRCR
jgi:tetratricopeptide (TPR) repeat protein